MRKFVCISALAVCLALAVTISAAAVEVEETFSKELPFTDNGTLVVSNQNGSITVQTWDGTTVVLDGRKVVKAGDEAEARQWMEKIKVTIKRASPDKIEIRTERPDNEGWSMFSFLFGERPTSRVDYRVWVPRQTLLWLTSVNGSLEVTEPGGRVNGETVNGSVKISGAAGPVRAETVNGQVELSFSTLLDTERSGEWLARLSSINGSVTIHLPRGTGADVTASTLNGAIRSDFDLPLSRELVGASATASVSGGGPEVMLETLNGSIQILETD